MKRTYFLPLALFALFSMGAKGNGCAVEYSPGDGSSSEWATGPIPTPETTTRPMSQEWLDSDNCWKQMVAEAQTCAAETRASVGTFDSDRETCSFKGGAEVELAGPISTPGSGTTLFEATDWKITDGKGSVCATHKILGLGKSIVDVRGKVALFESLSITKFRVTCPDGKTYGNEVPGTSASFGLSWLAHRTPGALISCTKEQCKLDLWGGAAGETNLATCK